MKAVIDYKELENFLAYLEDKADEVYEREVKQAIERFMKEQVTKMSGDIVRQNCSANGPFNGITNFELGCVMEIRKANSKDALGVAKVQVDSWKTTYKNIIPDEYLEKMTYENREKKWQDIISNQSVFVAENNSEIIGFSNGGKERTGKYPDYKGELYAIYILEEYQRKGIGKLLLEPVVESLKQENIFSMTVSVLEDNDSRLFYEYFGARKIDTVELEVAGKELNEVVYGWKDITAII